MARWPLVGPVAPHVLSPWFEPKLGRISTTVSASSTLGANTIRYLPYVLPEPCRITNLWWQNGTVASGNLDVGVYNSDGKRLVSAGSTAQSGTSVIQSVDITDTELPAGLIYFALVFDNSTGTIWHTGTNYAFAWFGLSGYLQTSTFPLPATATFATSIGAGVGLYKFGALKHPRTVL